MQTLLRSLYETVHCRKFTSISTFLAKNIFLRYKILPSSRVVSVRRCNEMGEGEKEGAEPHEEDPEPNEDWYVALGAEVGDEEDGGDVADPVHGGEHAGGGGGDLVALLDGADHRVEIARTQCLLEHHQQ